MLKWLFPTFASCIVCGREDISSLDTGFCAECLKEMPFAKENDALFYYTGSAPNLIQDLKYNNKRYLAEIFAKLSAEKLSHFSYDIICFVPTRHKRERGYNQAELIALAIDKEKTVDALEKIKDTVSQTELSRAERIENVKGCFVVSQTELVEGKLILLVDDTITTGSTTNECKKELLKAGALGVSVFTVCKAVD